MQRLEDVEELAENMEGSRQTGILIMDFVKAFHKVNHSLLLHKFQHYNYMESEVMPAYGLAVS